MTILEASGLLYEWFSKNDSFLLQEDFMKLIMVTDHPSRDKAAVLGALESFKETHIVREVRLNEGTAEEGRYWILNKNFETFEQSVVLSPYTVTLIAKIINDFCDKIGDRTEYVDPLKIEEKDIQNLIVMTNEILTKED